MVRTNSMICVAIVFMAALNGCGDDDSEHVSARDKAYTEAVEFIEEHWSAELLVAAFNQTSVDIERSGEGLIYFPVFEPIATVEDLDNLPLWVSREEDEEEFLRNTAVWLQFIFGWDDFRRASIPRPEFDYEPTMGIDDLRQPWVSANREILRQLLVEAGVALPAR